MEGNGGYDITREAVSPTNNADGRLRRRLLLRHCGLYREVEVIGWHQSNRSSAHDVTLVGARPSAR